MHGHAPGGHAIAHTEIAIAQSAGHPQHERHGQIRRVRSDGIGIVRHPYTAAGSFLHGNMVIPYPIAANNLAGRRQSVQGLRPKTHRGGDNSISPAQGLHKIFTAKAIFRPHVYMAT